MATSLLRLGRLGALKRLQVDSWGVLRSSTAPLCTQSEEPAKKTKAASKSKTPAVSPDDRAALLAYKTAVAFPVRFSQSQVFPAQTVGAAEPVVTTQADAATASVTVAEAAAAAPPEPEEPFDNSTYKNYQHHNYNPYTFADLDLEMAKFRLPQPSSGRPSPRH
ncbi:hypothetical protein INR49_029999 [Caranx melampygus]|nr:hypothetical protein INR49_029999 [Caranx melampygus]